MRIADSVRTAFAGVRPEIEARMNALRWSDQLAVNRMLASDPTDWSDDDIDVVMAHAQTTLGGPETFKWILPHWLDRSVANPAKGWMTTSEVLADKLDYAGFDRWPEAQQASILDMLAEWLDQQAKRWPEDPDYSYDAGEDEVLRRWLKARKS